MESQAPPSRPTESSLRPSSVVKVNAILDAAETVFLQHGYADAAMDQVSAQARVSKQTIYTHFGDKERLFLAVVTRVTADAAMRVHHDVPDPRSDKDLTDYLESYARRQLDIVLNDRLLAVRRLVIAEAPRFPELARAFWEQGPASATEAMRVRFSRFADAGLLDVPDPSLSARTFNWMVMGDALNAAMLRGAEGIPDAASRRETAAEATRVFLAAHRADQS